MENKDYFRDYDKCPQCVIDTYKLNHKYQTLEFVKEQNAKFCIKFDRFKMSIWDAIDMMDNIVDESDPDLDLHQTIHAYQTAEGLRTMYPELDYLHLVGLIHDLGKIIALPAYGDQPQWCTVGDTFPVGCKFGDKVVFTEFFETNPDNMDLVYSSVNGVYEPNCGLDKVLFSFGHDEYLYQVLKHNKCKIPELGLNIIRYHSFYSWHKDGAYEHLMSKDDYELRDWCKKFSSCDLYTKDNFSVPDIDRLKPYYEKLIKKYFETDILEW